MTEIPETLRKAEEEVWKVLPDSNGMYEVSSLGRIKSLYPAYYGRILKPFKDKKGRLSVLVIRNNVAKTRRLHRLIAETFTPNPENKSQVNHINGIPSDNRVKNLEWATPSENTLHAFRLGLVSKAGEKSPAAKLTESKVKRIHLIHALTPTLKGTDIGRLFNVSNSAIYSVLRGDTWRDIFLARDTFLPSKPCPVPSTREMNEPKIFKKRAVRCERCRRTRWQARLEKVCVPNLIPWAGNMRHEWPNNFLPTSLTPETHENN